MRERNAYPSFELGVGVSGIYQAARRLRLCIMSSRLSVLIDTLNTSLRAPELITQGLRFSVWLYDLTSVLKALEQRSSDELLSLSFQKAIGSRARERERSGSSVLIIMLAEIFVMNARRDRENSRTVCLFSLSL